MTTHQPAALPECIAHVEDWPDDRTPIGLVWDVDPKSVPVGTKLYALTTSQPAQAGDEHHVLCDGDIEELAIFHAPPIHPDFKDDDDFVEFGRAIERKVIQRMLTSLPTQPAAQATPDDGFEIISYQVNDIAFSPEAAEAASKQQTRYAEVRRVDENTVDIGRVWSFAQATPEPVLFNGLTESETNATASVMGLTATPPQQAAGEPVGREFFAWDPEGGQAFYKTQQEAIDHAKESLKYYRDGANDHGEWDEDVEQVRWGVVMQRVKATNISATEDDESSCDYELQDVATHPAPGVPEGWLIERRPDLSPTALVVRSPKDGPGFMTLESNHSNSAYRMLYRLASDLIAAAQAKGGA